MHRIRWIAPCFVIALGAVTRPSAAQDVAEIQVLPADLTLEVGEQGIVIATLFDARGTPITTGAQLTWVSNNLPIASVSFDPNTPNFVTITAVSSGVAQIRAISGNISSTVVVTVRAAIQQPQVQPAVSADSILPDSTSIASRALVSRIEPFNFGFAQDCRVGGFVGANLLLTTYLAIRGADSIVVVLPSGQRVTSRVRVAAYDAASDLVVLHVPVQRTGQLSVGQDPSADDFVWVVGQPNCQATQNRRAEIADAPSSGPLTLSLTLGLGQLGAPIINQDGAIVGLASGGSSAIRATDVASITGQALRNLASGSLLTAVQMAEAEQHRYGSVVLRSNMTNATARIAPQEDWHWQELAGQNTLPFTFSGPEGRYRVDLVASGAVQNSITVTIEAGVANQLLLTPTILAQQETPVEEPQPPGAQISPEGGGGGGAIIAVVLLLAGGGAAAAFLLKPKDTGPGPGSGFGSIRIVIPSN